MLRRPDFEPEPDRRRRRFGRMLLVVAALALVLLSAAWLSPLGAVFGMIASLLTILFGVCTGWFVTYVIKLPRDGRGFHERHHPQGSDACIED